MANRFPLIADASTQKIKELPSGDNLDLTGNGISAVRNIIPETDSTYNLGSPSIKWNELYLAGNSLYLGASKISFNGTVFIFESGNNSTTLPLSSGGGALVTLAGTDTLTNKTIAAGSNTITGLTNSNLSGSAGITNANLENSAVTVGTTSISLGSSTTTITGLTSVTSTSFVGALTGNASTATTLATARTIAMTGDVAWTSESFNGSANVTGTATLASVGTAGTYTKVTTDSKGRVTSGTILTASDIPSLDASKITTGTIDAARLPSYVDDVIEGSNLAAFPATGETGKIYVALDTNKTYRWSGSAYVYITSGAVDSVAGKTGVVTLVKGDVGLGNVDNTSDVNKPISTATQTALDLKAPLASPTFTGTVSGITKSMVGLGSVDNTADASKNVLSATKLTTARTINGVSFDGTANITVADATKQPLDADLTAIAALIGTSGLLKKTAADTWSLDTNTYLTSAVTSVTGTAPIVSSGGNTPAISIPAATASVNGYMTSAYASKLDGIAAGATNVTNTNQLTNGAGYITSSGNAATATTATNQSGGTVNATSANANYLGVNNTTGSNGYGLSLYGGATSSQPTYGIMFQQTATFGTHGSVTADWATYFTMDSTANRGWIFRNASTPTNVASINNSGTAVFNGNVTAYSDEKLKKDWLPVSEGFIEQLAKVKSGTYTRIDTGERHAGSSAQDWKKLLPEVVVGDEDLSLAYGNAALVAAIELAKQVVEMKKQIEELKAKLGS